VLPCMSVHTHACVHVGAVLHVIIGQSVGTHLCGHDLAPPRPKPVRELPPAGPQAAGSQWPDLPPGHGGIWKPPLSYPCRLASWLESSGQKACLVTGIRRPGCLLEEAPVWTSGGGGTRLWPLITSILECSFGTFTIFLGMCFGLSSFLKLLASTFEPNQ
jgi:hypothetical protein